MRIIKVLMLSVFFPLIVSSQVSLGTRDAVKMALENNYQVKIADQRERITEKNNNWMEAGAFPSVSLSVANNNAIQDNTNNPFTFTPGIILSQTINPVLSANWNLFSGMAVIIQKDRLELLEKQSNQNAMLIIENTTQDVLKAYYTATLQRDRLQLSQDLLSVSRKRYQYYQLREKYSSANSLELLQFRNQYLNDSMNLLLQEVNVKTAQRNLKILMNDTTETIYSLVDQFNFTLSAIDRQQAHEDLTESNSNLKNQYINLELQQKNTSYQRSFLYPTLSVQAGLSPSWSWIREVKNDLFEAETNTLSYYGNINLRYTLFNNWKNMRAVEVSKIQEEISHLQIDEMKRNLSRTLNNLIDLYETRSKLVLVANESVDYAKKAFELAQTRFETGGINSIELTTFQNNYQNAVILYQEQQFNLLDTYLEIYKMTGKIGLTY